MADVNLEIVDGPGAGRQISLDRPIEIGRDPSADVVLDDDLVSRRHARVAPLNGTAVVEDLGSRNGSFVNGNEVHAPAHLGPGDRLLIGVTLFELRTTRQIAAQPSAVMPRPPALATPPRRPDYIPREVEQGQAEGHVLDPLLDIHTKGRAKIAPLAIFVVVVIVVPIFLATR